MPGHGTLRRSLAALAFSRESRDQVISQKRIFLTANSIHELDSYPNGLSRISIELLLKLKFWHSVA